MSTTDPTPVTSPKAGRQQHDHAALAHVSLTDITELSVYEIMGLLDVPRETAVMLQDPTIIDSDEMVLISGRKKQTIGFWRAAFFADIESGRDPAVNPNALIRPELKDPHGSATDRKNFLKKHGKSYGTKSGRFVHFLIDTLRFDAYTREPVRHISLGRHAGTHPTT